MMAPDDDDDAEGAFFEACFLRLYDHLSDWSENLAACQLIRSSWLAGESYAYACAKLMQSGLVKRLPPTANDP